MKNNPGHKRRNYFINKEFQGRYIFNYFILATIGSILFIGVFSLFSFNTFSIVYDNYHLIDGFTPGECFNLASKFESTNIDLTRNLTSIIGCKNDLIRFVDDRPAHDRRYALDGSRFMNRFGWLPRYSFDRALEKTVKWYLDNQDWLKSRRTKEYDEYFDRQYGAL